MELVDGGSLFGDDLGLIGQLGDVVDGQEHIFAVIKGNSPGGEPEVFQLFLSIHGVESPGKGAPVDWDIVGVGADGTPAQGAGTASAGAPTGQTFVNMMGASQGLPASSIEQVFVRAVGEDRPQSVVEGTNAHVSIKQKNTTADILQNGAEEIRRPAQILKSRILRCYDVLIHGRKERRL